MGWWHSSFNSEFEEHSELTGPLSSPAEVTKAVSYGQDYRLSSFAPKKRNLPS